MWVCVHRGAIRVYIAAAIICCSAPLCRGFQCVGDTLRWTQQLARGSSAGHHTIRQGCGSVRSWGTATPDAGPAAGRRSQTSSAPRMQLQGRDQPRLPCLLHDGLVMTATAGASISTDACPENDGKAVGTDRRQRQQLLSAIASIIIAAFTLTACGMPGAVHAEFDPSDRSRPADEVVLDMKNMQEACSNGWAPNWRETGKASICLEPDGCLWRKLDFSAREPGRKWYANAYDKSAKTYNVPFVNYLTRYIINYDPRWQGWWTLRQEAHVTQNTEQAAKKLEGELQRFAGSVEYGLSNYQGAQGVKRLFNELELNYVRDSGEGSEEARRQLALTFSLLDPTVQPVDDIRAVTPRGTVKDSARVSAKTVQEMYQLASESLRAPLVVDKGVRPAMLPKDIAILEEQGAFTLPGFLRPEGATVRRATRATRARHASGGDACSRGCPIVRACQQYFSPRTRSMHSCFDARSPPLTAALCCLPVSATRSLLPCLTEECTQSRASLSLVAGILAGNWSEVAYVW